MARHFWRLRCPEGHVVQKQGLDSHYCESCSTAYPAEEWQDVTPDPHETTNDSRIGQVWTADRGFVRPD